MESQKLDKTKLMENNKKQKPSSESKAQLESKYDSHSEEKPKQKTTVATDEEPDRVSHDNTDNYLEKLPREKEKAQVLVDETANHKPKRIPK
jgi:hypothetical protein